MANQRCSPEFKDEALRQMVDRGYSIAEVTERLPSMPMLAMAPLMTGARWEVLLTASILRTS